MPIISKSCEDIFDPSPAESAGIKMRENVWKGESAKAAENECSTAISISWSRRLYSICSSSFLCSWLTLSPLFWLRTDLHILVTKESGCRAKTTSSLSARGAIATSKSSVDSSKHFEMSNGVESAVLIVNLEKSAVSLKTSCTLTPTGKSIDILGLQAKVKLPSAVI